MTDVAQCLSRSCTTGWFDWIHGELWLSTTSLVRRRLSLAVTIANGVGPTVRTPLPEVQLSGLALARLLGGHRTNRFVDFDAVAQARLVKGMTSDALRLTMRDGTRHKFLWLRRDPAYAVLSSTLPVALGGRFSQTPTLQD